MNGMNMIDNGTWDFKSGVGKMKNKSQITLYTQSVVQMGLTNTFTGNYVTMDYDLKELRNNKMVWYYHSTYQSTSGYSTEYVIEFVFEQL